MSSQPAQSNAGGYGAPSAAAQQPPTDANPQLSSYPSFYPDPSRSASANRGTPTPAAAAKASKSSKSSKATKTPTKTSSQARPTYLDKSSKLFSAPSKLLIGASAVSLVGLVLAVVAVATPSWYTASLSLTGISFDLQIGLSFMCLDGVCTTYDSSGGGGSLLDRAHAATGLLVIGILFSFLTFVLSSVLGCCSCCAARGPVIRPTTLLFSITSTLFLLVGFAVGASMLSDLESASQGLFTPTMGYSAGLAIVSWILMGAASGLVAGTLWGKYAVPTEVNPPSAVLV